MNAPHVKERTAPEQALADLGERCLLRLSPQQATIPSANDTAMPIEPAAIGKQIAAIAREPSQHDAKLLHLQRIFAFSDAALLASALAFRVETDPFFAHQIARFQEPLGRSHLLIGFLASAFALDDARMLELAQGPVVSSGLLELGAEEAPVCERSLSMPPALLSALKGAMYEVPFAKIPDIPEVIFPSHQQDDLNALAGWLAHKPGRLLHMRSAEPDECMAASAIVARRSGRRLVLVNQDCAVPPAWLALANAMPAYSASLGVGESWSLPTACCRVAPHIVVSTLDGRVETTRETRDWRGEALNVEGRQEVWQAWGQSAIQAQSLARRYRQGAGAIARAARAVRSKGQDDAHSADWLAHTNPELDRLAQRCPVREVPDAALVAPDALLADLRQVENRILLREQLAQTLGPALSARYRPGVRALFTGESGTGKTLAAHWLAARLGLPLYRVDMAALSSKWIGETEKNLSQLLSAAETSDAILFFDEADSLFGSRTDIGDSNDRHANAQTNFLLQRIEDFEGIALLTTNSRDRFDSAFVRRLDAILEFPLPDAAARSALWHAHLGESHHLSNADIDTLARELDFPGGHIRNIVLGAATYAASEARPICGSDLDRALAEECRKLGRTPPSLRLA